MEDYAQMKILRAVATVVLATATQPQSADVPRIWITLFVRNLSNFHGSPDMLV